MLLAIDVGNTQTVFGLFDGAELADHWRIATEANRTGDELGALVTRFLDLDKVDGIWTGQLRAAAEAAGPDPADQLVGLFDALVTACRREAYRGCAFINAAAEAMPGTPLHERTVAHKRAVMAWVRDLAAKAGAGDPDALARSLTLLLDGGLADGALTADPAAVVAAKETARQLVASAVVRAA